MLEHDNNDNITRKQSITLKLAQMLHKHITYDTSSTA